MTGLTKSLLREVAAKTIAVDGENVAITLVCGCCLLEL